MADLATAIVKLAETLEKFYPILDQMTRIQQQAAGATSKDGKQTQEQTQLNTTSTEGGDKEDTKNDYGKAISSGLSLAMLGFNALDRLGHTQYAQQTTLGPVEEASKVIDAYSKAGYIMSQKEAESLAGQVASQQNTAKINYGRFDPLVDRGVVENATRNIAQKAFDFIQDFYNNPLSTIKDVLKIEPKVTLGADPAAQAGGVKAANLNHLGE